MSLNISDGFSQDMQSNSQRNLRLPNLPRYSTCPTLPYNRRHRTARATIERSFGQVKQRFACLQTCLKIQLRRVPKTIQACFILHYICRETGDDIPTAIERINPRSHPEDTIYSDLGNHALRRLGEQKRDEVAMLLNS